MEDPTRRRTIVSPGSSSKICFSGEVAVAWTVSSTMPNCPRSLAVIAPSSKNATLEVAPWASLKAVKNRETSDSMPIPPAWPRGRIRPKGVSMLRRPDFAISPATKEKVPRVTSNGADIASPPNPFNNMRALSDKLNAVPSMKRMPTRPPAAVSMMSP